jgi:RNA polymerase sigma-70 factor (ECF subfamily)
MGIGYLRFIEKERALPCLLAYDNVLYNTGGALQQVWINSVSIDGRGFDILRDVNSELSDEALLVEKAKNFDSDAWAQIYQRYHPKIYTYLYHRLEDTYAAEDIAADVFLRACEKIGSYSYRGTPFIAWLYRIARNKMVDHLRYQAKIKKRPLNEEALEQSLINEDTTEGTTVREELKGVLKNLTEDQRQVILLKYFGDLSNADVAGIIGKSEGAVKALQHRALASLKRILETEGKSGEGI